MYNPYTRAYTHSISYHNNTNNNNNTLQMILVILNMMTLVSVIISTYWVP